jgi:hypothetical protein
MSDTQRDLASLLALFADNTAGGISEQDARDFMVSAFGGYASCYIDAGSTSQVAASGAGTPMGQFTSLGPASGVTISPGTGIMTFAVAGDYLVDFSIDFEGVAGRLYTFSAFTSGLTGSALVNAAAERTAARFSNIITVTAGQAIQLKAKCDVSNLFTARSGHWLCKRVG